MLTEVENPVEEERAPASLPPFHLVYELWYHPEGQSGTHTKKKKNHMDNFTMLPCSRASWTSLYWCPTSWGWRKMSDKVTGPPWSPNCQQGFLHPLPFLLTAFFLVVLSDRCGAGRSTLEAECFRGDICFGGQMESWDFVENEGAEREALAAPHVPWLGEWLGFLRRLCTDCPLNSEKGIS